MGGTFAPVCNNGAKPRDDIGLHVTKVSRRVSIHQVAGCALVVAVGSSAFLDDLLEGRPLRGPDFLLAGLLAIAATATSPPASATPPRPSAGATRSAR